MKTLRMAAAALVSIGLGAQPATAADCWAPGMIEAAKLRQLDVMLMVSALRCRTGPDGFQADYEGFLTRHRPALGKANHEILDAMRSRLGAVGAISALDRMSVTMANRYGQQGAFGCGELKMVARELASGGTGLADAADLLVGADVKEDACPTQIAAIKAP